MFQLLYNICVLVFVYICEINGFHNFNVFKHQPNPFLVVYSVQIN